MSPTIAENLSAIKSTLPENVRLCAVSKFNPASSVVEALEAGQFLFGENRVQEASGKWDELKEKTPLWQKAELHIIGQLQTNKVKKAVQYASCIQSVDRIELLEEIQKQCVKIDRKIDVMLEVHTGEDSKSGFESKELLMEAVKMISEGKFPNIRLIGLMTMAPFTDDVEMVRKAFSSTRQLKERINVEYPSIPLTELSMGMSGDYRIAIEEGSTMVRIGTAIFGQRDYSK